MEIAHGSSGVDSRGPYYAAQLNRAGIATLEIDMWAPRGLVGGAAGRPRTIAETLPDAFGGLKMLAADSRIDPKRIGIMGFSWVGSARAGHHGHRSVLAQGQGRHGRFRAESGGSRAVGLSHRRLFQTRVRSVVPLPGWKIAEQIQLAIREAETTTIPLMAAMRPFMLQFVRPSMGYWLFAPPQHVAHECCVPALKV